MTSAVPLVAAESVQLFEWKSVNIQGMGYVTGLVIQPGDPYDVYIRTDVGGTYRFDRSASRWIPLMDRLATQAGIGTETVAIDPGAPDRVYAVINRQASINGGKYNYAAEVMVSEDRGLTWRGTGLVQRGVYQGSNDNYRVETGERLAVDPNNSNVLYFATRRDGLWRGLRQADAHYQWSKVQGGLPAPGSDDAGHTFVLFDRSTAKAGTTQTIYVGVYGSGVWRSTDGGTNWTAIGPAKSQPGRGTVASDGTLYVSFSNGVQRYRKGQWADITPGVHSAAYTGITADPGNPDTVMVGRDDMVYRSTSAGALWSSQKMVMHRTDPYAAGSNPSAPAYYLSATAGASGGVAAMVIDPANPKQVWWTNGWGVARTDDVTAAPPFWAWRMSNLEELVGVMVRVPPKPKADGGADLIGLSMDVIGFRHADKDQAPDSKISPAGVPFDPNPRFSWQANMFGGATYPAPWPHVSMGSSVDYSYYKPDNLVYVGWGEWQMWSNYGSSSDNGRTWTAFPSVPSEMLWSGGVQQKSMPVGGHVAMSSTNPLNFIWVPTWGSFDGLNASADIAPWPQYTMDGGKTWNLCKLAQPPAKPSPYDPHNNADVHYDALPRAWANSLHPYVSTNVVAADRKDPDGKTFYYFDGHSPPDGTFYYSTDGGATWTRSDTTGFPGNVVRVTIASNPAKKGDVWLALARNGDDVNGYGLYHSADGGRTFATLPGVDVCDKVAFGKGHSDSQPFLYILGRVNGATRDALYKSEDGGQTWIRISNPDTHAMMDVVHMEGDMRTPNLLYLARGGRGIMYGMPPANPAPKPVVWDRGVVNGASFAAALTRGAVASIFGENLASDTAHAPLVPLARELGGVEVTVDDQPAPLWYVSPGQINFQMPWEAPLTGAADLRVYNGLAASEPYTLALAPSAPGVFQYDSAQGARESIITHADYSLVTAQNPASSGEEVVVWMTGFGSIASSLPETGFGSPGGATASDLPSASLSGVAAPVTYAGLTAGATGLAQVQIKVPSALPAGNPLSLVVTEGGVDSKAVPVWVRQP